MLSIYIYSFYSIQSPPCMQMVIQTMWFFQIYSFLFHVSLCEHWKHIHSNKIKWDHWIRINRPLIFEEIEIYEYTEHFFVFVFVFFSLFLIKSSVMYNRLKSCTSSKKNTKFTFWFIVFSISLDNTNRASLTYEVCENE